MTKHQLLHWPISKSNLFLKYNVNHCCTWVIKLALIQPLEKDVPTTWDMEWVAFLRKSRSSACSLLDYRLGIGNLSPLNCWKNWPVWQASVSTICAEGLITPEQRTFLLDFSLGRGRVYKWKFCLSVCLSVITSYYFPSSASKLTQPPPVDLLVTQPFPRYPTSPIHVSHARQSTGPPS